MGENPSKQQTGDAGNRNSEPVSTTHHSQYSKSTRLATTLSLLGGFLLVSTSVWLHQQERVRETPWLSGSILVIGIFLFLASMHITDFNKIQSLIRRPFLKIANWFGIKGWQVICLLVCPLFALVGWYAAGTGEKMHNPILAVLSWPVGIGLAMLAGWRFSHQRIIITPRLALMATTLFLFALLVRGIDLSSIPVVLTGDEGSAGLSAVEFVRGNTNNIFRTGWFSFPSFYFFIQSIPIALLGQTILALRISSIIAGALTVVGVYFVGRAMFGNRAGLFSALFLATFHFHNHFSRIGLNNVWDSMWFVLVLGLLWLGWQDDNRRLLLLSGLALGLSQYFYASARLLFVFIPIWLIVVASINPSRFRQNLPSLGLMGVVCLVTILPLAFYYLGHPDQYMAPLRRASIFGGWLTNEIQFTGKSSFQILLNQFWLSIRAYAHHPLRVWYTPGVPLLRPLPAAIFFLGIALLLLKLRDSRTTLLGLWLMFLTMMVGMSESTPAAQRYVAVSPAVALLVGYALDRGARHLGKMWPQKIYWVNALVVALIVFISVDDLRFYFLDYTPRSDFGGENTLVAHQLANYLSEQPDNLEVLFLGGSRMGYYSHSSLPYLTPHIKGVDIKHPWGSAENPQPSRHNLAFVALPETIDELEKIMVSYPGGDYKEFKKKDGQTLFWLYRYPSTEQHSGETLLPALSRFSHFYLQNTPAIGRRI